MSLRLENITAGYSGTTVLRGVTLVVPDASARTVRPRRVVVPPTHLLAQLADASRAVGNWPVTTKITRLATETAWSAIRS